MSLTYGKSQNWIEDMYLMKGDDSGATSSADFQGVDMGSNNAQYPQEVIISCPNKMGRVRASVGGPIQLNVSSQWEPMFGGGIGSMTNSFLGVVNQLTEWGLGCTIQQPWMNRKNYKNTQPFSFTLPLNFVAMEDAKEDVVKPCLALVSFLYPRKYTSDPTNTNTYKKFKDASGNGMPSYVPMSAIGSSNAATEAGTTMLDEAKRVPFLGKMVKNMKKDSVIGSALDMFELWEIPGPGLLTGEQANKAHKGDIVDIIVGKMFNLGNCYLENVDVTFGNSFDKNGYPLSAKVNVKCTCADSVVCSSTGNLLVNQVYDQTGGLQNFVDACQTTIEHTIENLSVLATGLKGFYSKGSLNVQTAS